MKRYRINKHRLLPNKETVDFQQSPNSNSVIRQEGIIRHDAAARLDRAFKFLISLAILCAIPNSALAFKISPCLRVLTMESGQLSQEPVRKLINQCRKLPKQYKSAVHEHMTLQVIRNYRGDGALEQTQEGWKYPYLDEKPWKKKPDGTLHLSRALMYGTWWNDDPLMFTWGQGGDFLNGVIPKLYNSLKNNRATYPGGIAKCVVPKAQYLVHWSHFGALQHLHFMTGEILEESTAAERVRSTTNSALTWMKFAYRVATRDLKPWDQLTPKLQEDAGLPSIAKNECVCDPKNVKIRTVFSRIGWKISDRNERTPDVALGSMLHVLQDSWSPSHTCRVVQQEVGQSQVAVLKDVKNYNEQILAKGGEDEHSELDLYPQWLIDEVVDDKRTYKNDPITVGTWLLAAVDQKLPWSDVKAYLQSTIFASADTLKSANKPCIY